MLDLRPLGAGVRTARKARGWTIRSLADRCGLSERFVSDLERGVGNISIGKLHAVSVALDVPLQTLVAPLDVEAAPAPDAVRTVALIGLRGAGKSTVGALAAGKAGVPFIELDDSVEAAAGLPLPQIFEIHGEAYYRRLERELLTGVVVQPAAPAVIAVGGGVVTDPESWRLLRAHARTVWLKASPPEHYRRVMAQGDLRPMKNRPAAMAELRALLAAREQHYREADLTVDTSTTGVATAAALVAGLID